MQHLGVDDVDDGRRIEPRERALRCGDVELDAAGEALRQAAEQQVRIRDRRLRAAAAVAGGARAGAGALWSDAQRATRVAPDE